LSQNEKTDSDSEDMDKVESFGKTEEKEKTLNELKIEFKKEFFKYKKEFFVTYKNFINSSYTYMKLFIKPYINYDKLKYINISHKHLSLESQDQKLKHKKSNIRKRLLNKIDKQLKSNTESLYKCYCEFTTVEGVIFGSLKVFENFIIFEHDISDEFKDYQMKKEFMFSSMVNNIT